MKKKLCSVILITIAVSLLFPAISSAGSPVTSTQFYTAYLDTDQIKKASNMPYIDEEIAGYPSDPENPLEIKAAVINTIGWEKETDEPITLTYFRRMPDNTEGAGEYQNAVYTELEKKTNIKLSFIDVSEDVILQKLNIMAAAGDTPDLIEFPWQRYTGFVEKMAEMGIIIKLDELIDKAAPSLSNILQLYPEVKNMIISDYDSHIYQIPGINLYGNTVATGPVIRGDLLKKYGLTAPKTIDEWEKMLTLFKDGGDSMIPLSLNMSILKDSSAFIGAFGIPFGFGVRDGKVFYGPIEDAYKDFLTTFNRWYKNGLIDPEFLLINNSQLNSGINAGKVGAFIGEADRLKESANTLKAIDASFELIPVQNPILPNVDTLTAKSGISTITECGIAISSRNKYPKESIQWIDYAYSDEGYRLFNSGFEGFTNQPDDEQTANGYLRKIPEVPGYKAHKSIIDYESPEQKTAVRLWSVDGGDNNPSVLPSFLLTEEKSSELKAIMNDLSAYTEEMFAKFVIVDVSPDKFDEYVKKATKMGVDRAIEIMQAALDRHNLSLSELKINGKTIKTDTEPYLSIEGEILLPIRFIIEGLGGSIAWNGSDKVVTGIYNNTVITLKLNRSEVMVDYKPRTLNRKVIAFHQRTYVPISFIQEALGVTVHLNENTRIVNVIGH